MEDGECLASNGDRVDGVAVLSGNNPVATIKFSGGAISDSDDDSTTSSECSVPDTTTPPIPQHDARIAKTHNKGNACEFNPFDKPEYSDDEQEVESLSSNIQPDNKKYDSDIVVGLDEDHFAPLDFQSLTSIEDITKAINKLKYMIADVEEDTAEYKSLVKKLINLQMKLAEVEDQGGDEGRMEELEFVLGHKFEKRLTNNSKRYCEKCASVIWAVIQNWHRCVDCGFSCHSKCLPTITRMCANVKVRENTTYIYNICPEKGLHVQRYRCAECHNEISYREGVREPRRCDYTGLYYCDLCHWNDTAVIPARVLHNWDLEPRKVCRASKQFLRLMSNRPVIRIQDVNPMLFTFVGELNETKRLREEILVMKRYFVSCKDALSSKLLLQLSSRQHFVDNSDMYSLDDILQVAADLLLPELTKIHASFALHIKTDCELCRAKGYLCELCDDKGEVLFPFDNIATVCPACSTVLHRHCYLQKSRFCPKCERLSNRQQQQENTESASESDLESASESGSKSGSDADAESDSLNPVV